MNLDEWWDSLRHFWEKSCGLAPLEKPDTLSPPRWARGTFLSPLYTPRTRSPLPCSLHHLANFSSTGIKLSKISALSGKPYVTQHNPLNLVPLDRHPPRCVTNRPAADETATRGMSIKRN